MKKISVFLVLVAIVMALFTICAFADEGTTTNIASEATITTSSGSWWITGNLNNLKDGDETTGMHSSNTDRETTVNFAFESERYITKIVMKVNGTATTSAMSHTDLNANTDYKITVNGATTTLNALDKTELVLDVNASISEFSVNFYSGWSANNALIREVEIYEYIPPVVESATGNNIEDDATIAIVDGNDYILGGAEYLRDNDPSTGLSAGDAASWINYHFLYERPRAITKVVVVVNSTGTMYKVGSADGTYVHETMSTLPNIYLRLYDVNGSTVYKLENQSTADAVEVTKDGKTYMEYTFDLGGALYEDIVKVEIATLHNSDTKLGVWEVEIIDFQCQSDDDHKYNAATCVTPATCKYCLDTTGEPSDEHTLLAANCGQPVRCKYCDYTEGEPTGEPHTWVNASYTAPKTCTVCGATEGDVWVDSDLEGFIRGPENDTITYDDIVGEVELISGSTGKGTPSNVLNGTVANTNDLWGGPTNSQIKITLKHEWEITSVQAILASNWASLKMSFYAADGTLLGELNKGGIQDNTDVMNGNMPAELVYNDYTGAIKNVSYGDSDNAVKYIIITNTGDKWGWAPAVMELYLVGRERIPFAGCETHSFVATYPTEPTCTTAGTMVNKCTVCGAEEAAVEAPALGHDMGEYTIKVPATCTEAGIIEFACKRCGETTERPTHIQDVTDYADQYGVVANGGGWTNGNMFDNNMDKFQQASSDWYLYAYVDLDMAYYLTSVTVWVGHTGSYGGDWNMTFYYQAPGSDEWISAGSKVICPYDYTAHTPVTHTLELATPVYADAVKIEATGVSHGSGMIYEAEIAGTIYADTAATGHTWEVLDVVAPKCYEHGYTNYYCSVCAAEKKDTFVNYTGHQWVDATCMAPKTCSACGATEGDVAAHELVHVDAVAATCMNEGNIEHWYCTVCECVWSDEALTQVTNHKSVITPVADHELVHVDAVEATCMNEGNIEHWYCTVCECVWSDEALTQVTNHKSVITPAADHELVYVEAVAATCTANGNVEHWYCTVCECVWSDEALTQVTNHKSVITPATGHSEALIEEKIDATCTTPGSITKICPVCLEEVSVEEIPVVEHNWDEGWIGWPYPTCQQNGTKEYTCMDCGATKTETVVADLENIDSHDCALDSETYVIANCQNGGYAKWTCNDCGKVFEIITEADTEDGHDWVSDPAKEVEATCAQDGYQFQTCSICGETREVVLDKEFFGQHAYGYDPETYVEATCQVDGYAFYTCEVCGDSYEETTPANPNLHEMVNSSNGLLQTCLVCGEAQFGNAEMASEDGTVKGLFVWNGTGLNIWNSEYDVYYNITVVSVENGVYNISLEASDDSFGINGDTAVLTLVDNGGTLVITAADGTVYTLESYAPDFNYLLNGTYDYYDPISGELKAKFKFENGTIYVLVDNMGMGFPESFAYTYDYYTGAISTPDVAFANFSVMNDTIYFGRGFQLVLVEDEPIEPDPEEPVVDYGDKIGSITVETVNTYGYNCMGDDEDKAYYEYIANVAGQYSFYVPAGLGLASKAAWEAYSAEIDFGANDSGYYVVVDLEAGETYVFTVGAEILAEWTIDVYFKATEPEHTHTEVEIPMVLPTPSVDGYTAGVMCSECGEILVAPVEITVTQMGAFKDPAFRVYGASLYAKENISLNFTSIVTEGYNKPYMVFVLNGVEYVVTDYTIDASTGRYKFNFAETFPQFMGDDIYAYVYAETAEGQYAMNRLENPYSVLKYIISQLKKNDAALTTAMSDILYMGAKTQIYMNYKTDALVTDLASAEGYTLTPTAFTSIPDGTDKQNASGDKDATVDWKAVTLAFGSTTEVVLRFTATDIDGLMVKINIAGVDHYYDPSELTLDEDGRYEIYFDQAKSFEYDETITATFERNGEQVGRTFTYSVNSFVARNYEKTSYSEAARDLMKALYVYGQSMATYFAD